MSFVVRINAATEAESSISPIENMPAQGRTQAYEPPYGVGKKQLVHILRAVRWLLQ